MRPITLVTRAPAKLNLTLEVLGKRDDGYHEIRSLVIGVGTYDVLAAKTHTNSELILRCSQKDLEGPENLILKAVKALAAFRGDRVGIDFNLQKAIPVAAGLGGGSSDAAAALRLCNEIWDLRLPVAQLEGVGASLGSDIPLFFHLPAAVITGRGEKVTPVQLAWNGVVLLVLPGLAVHTAEVYRVWRREDRLAQPESDIGAVGKLASAAAVMEKTTNQLAMAANRACPALVEFMESLHRSGFGGFQLTGSGPTLYRLYDDPAEARAIGGAIERQFRVRTVTAPAPVGIEPVIKET